MTNFAPKHHFLTLLFLALLSVLFILAGPTQLCAQELPKRYTVYPQKDLLNFSFQEDIHWMKKPKRLQLIDLIKEENTIILHFWSTFCGPCRLELPHFEEITRAYTGKPIKFFAISVNDPRPGVVSNYFIANKLTHLKPYHLPNNTRPRIRGIPVTFFLNKSGKLIGRIEGPVDWAAPEMKRLLDRLIAQKAPSEISAQQEWYERGFQWLKNWF